MAVGPAGVVAQWVQRDRTGTAVAPARHPIAHSFLRARPHPDAALEPDRRRDRVPPRPPRRGRPPRPRRIPSRAGHRASGANRRPVDRRARQCRWRGRGSEPDGDRLWAEAERCRRPRWCRWHRHGRPTARSRAGAAARSAPRCASPRFRKSTPSASYSTAFHPIPTPRRTRPGREGGRAWPPASPPARSDAAGARARR